MKIEDRNVPRSECPDCYYAVNSASCVNEHGAQPSPGDLTVCINCAGLFKFDEKLQMEQLSEEERALLMADPKVAEIVLAAKMALKTFKRRAY